MKNVFVIIFAALSIGLTACDSDNGSSDDRLSLSLSNVEPLTNGFHYEGWLIIGGQPISTGKFNVSSQGALITLNGSSIGNGMFELDADIDAATAFVLTIEPDGDTDTLPSTTKYMGGALTNGIASLSVAHGSSLGSNFVDASGEYILATPSDGPNSNETSGIWWLNPSGPSMAPGLTLPSLPSGWKYEGWVVVAGVPVTTGTFSAVSGADDFSGFSGTLGTPPFPGEDFIQNAPNGLTFPVNLNGGTAVISIEPYPDSDPAPFTLKPLVGTIPSSATPMTLYQMTSNVGGFPSGSVNLN